MSSTYARGSQAALIAEAATARGIAVERHPRAGVVLTHEGVGRRFFGGNTQLNPRLVKHVTRQKEVTSRLLRHAGVPAPDNAVFTDEARAWSWAEPALPVVVKPNAGTKGRLVYVGIGDRGTFTAAFDRVFDRHGQVLIEEQTPGVEHRFTYVDGEVPAVTRRVPMHVVGDGTSTVSELIDAKNAERRRRRNPIHKLLSVDPEVERVLTDGGRSIDNIPDLDATVWLRRTSNISIGGDAIDATDEIKPDHIETVVQAARAIPGLRLAGFDVLIDDHRATILEVNCAPMLSMHHYPWRGQERDVISDVLDAMFPETRLRVR